MASEGYPFDHKDKLERVIDGLTEGASSEGIIVFHAGTRFEDGFLVTDGGRVLDVVGLDKTPQGSRAKAYGYVNLVHFAGEQHRMDINLDADKGYFTGVQHRSNVNNGNRTKT
jgi:phosphoribosylamine--glycine ligase